MNKCNIKSQSLQNPRDTRKKYLEDVVILRLLLIFLLIWNHAFAPWAGHWTPLHNQEDIPLYRWLVLLAYNMQFQGLIFISGYLLGYASHINGYTLTLKSCVVKKIKRLILPSIIFSCLYYMLFYDTTRPISSVAYSIVNGCGHMWYLPMLFWCFVGLFLVEKMKIKPVIVLSFAILLALLPYPDLPFRIDRTFRYFLYFYIGFGIQRGYFNKFKPKTSIRPILTCIGIYLAVFVINYLWLDKILDFLSGASLKSIENANNALVISKFGGGILRRFLSVSMSVSGLLGAFWSANYFVVGKYRLPDWLIKLSTYCYGVYICQQFILIHMYYHTDLPDLVGPIALPWIALFLTLVLSLLITHLLLMTKVGRYLLG